MCALPSPQRVSNARRSSPVNRPSTRGRRNGAGHHPVELAAAAERHRAGRRSEVGDDAGQHLIAFLPVAARHVKRQPGPVAPLGRPAEGDVRALGREAPVLDDHLVRRRTDRSVRPRSAGAREAAAAQTVPTRGGCGSASAARASASDADIGVTPGGGVTTRCPSPRCSENRPDGQSSTLCSRRARRRTAGRAAAGSR